MSKRQVLTFVTISSPTAQGQRITIEPLLKHITKNRGKKAILTYTWEQLSLECY